MTMQYSVAVRNARLDSFESTVGATAKLQLRTGAAPANCAAGDTGTLLAEITLPADYMANASAGSKAKNGTWQGSASSPGTVGHFRVKDNAGTSCHAQGSAGVAVPLSTNGATAANSNVLNFASTTGVAVGMNASGAGVADGSTVLAVGGTTVTLSRATSGVASGAAITFSPDMAVDNATLAALQTVIVTGFTLTAGNA